MAARVVHFIYSLERGGAEGQAVALLRGLDRSRYEPHLISVRAVDAFGVTREVPSRSISPAGHFDARSFVRLVEALREVRPAIVHSWMGSMNWYARLAAPLAGSPRVVGSVRAMNLPRADVLREAASAPLVDAIVVNSVGTRDELVRRAGVAASKIAVIENGLDPARFAPLDVAARATARRRLGFDGRRAVVVPARICAQKNQLSIVDALAALRRDRALPDDARVYIYGRADSAATADALRARVAAHDLGAHVEVREPTPEVAEVLAAADATLLPSLFEGLPNAVIESLACGTPAVVTPAANVDVLVVDGRDGFVSADPSPASIADALRRLFALDEPHRAELGRRARAHACERFTIRRMVASTEALYDRVLSG